jgi:hypothetical protein
MAWMHKKTNMKILISFVIQISIINGQRKIQNLGVFHAVKNPRVGFVVCVGEKPLKNPYF